MAIEVRSVHERRRLPRLKGAAEKLRQHARRAHRRTLVLRAFVAALSLLAVSALATLAYFYSHYSAVVDERLASGYLTSRAGIYAAPRVLRTGQRISRERLVETLRRAGYVDSEASDVWSGRFTAREGGVEIRPRRQMGAAAAARAEVVRVQFDGRGHIASIEGDGAALDSYALEPEPLTNDAAMKTGQRAALSYQDIPEPLVRAVLSIEDRRFFEHGGLDAIGIARALWSWGGEAGGGGQDLKQGGSTITQQLVKNTYLTPERTLRRKFHEAVLSSVLERRLSKQDIFALYCNEIYLGQRGGIALRGVAQAARVFFGKELKDLTLAESATIAGMIQSPGRYAPDRRPDNARVRRDTVIAAMVRDGAITPEEARAATAERVSVVPAEEGAVTAPYFIDYVNRLAEARGASSSGAEGASGKALRVHTTIDLELQRLAEASVGRQLERLEKVYKGRRRPQAALVALDPHTGEILAMVGGRDYAESQLNRATDARRQPGSVFKPVVYAAAMEGGVSPLAMGLDAPREFTYDRRAKYRPANYGGGYSMREVTLRTALVRSLNVVTVDVAMRTGLSRVASLAEDLGLPRPESYPSLALGTTEATPLEVATAYAALANGGRAVRPVAVARYDDTAHEAADAAAARLAAAPHVLKPSTSYMLTDILGDVIEKGTARAARGALKGTAVAGKTGTSRDGWFAGYTPNLVCVVWVGFDDNDELGLTGAESALPVWQEFVRGAVDLRPELGGDYFERPSGIATVEVDPETGALASASCPQRERVAVTPALAPGHECLRHTQVYETLALADETGYAEGEDGAQTSVIVYTDGSHARAAVASPSALRQSPVAPPQYAIRPAVPAGQPAEPAPGRPTRVEVTREGRPTLTNELRAVADGAGRARQR